MTPPAGAHVFPQDQLAYRYDGQGRMSTGYGTRVRIYQDEDVAQLAQVHLLATDALATGSWLTVGRDSLLPLFWEPTGLTRLWGLVEGTEVPYPIDSLLADRLTAVEASLGLRRFLHTQAIPDYSWTFNHNLGHPPVAAWVFDSAGNEVDGTIVDSTSLSVTLSFSVSFSGTAVIF